MKHWKEICAKAEGSYSQIAQAGGVVAVATPYDKRLAEINGELTRSTLVYGNAAKRGEAMSGLGAARALPPAAAADRAAFAGKAGRVSTYDLLDGIKSGKVKLEGLKEAELPAELKKLKPEERKEYLAKLEKRRAELGKEAVDLDKKRAEFIAKKLKEQKKDGKDSFDTQVLETLRKQAKKHKIDY
jgi:hypothetical protein